MAQIIQRQTELAVSLTLIGLFVLVALGIGIAAWRGFEDTGENEIVQQPVPFSHKHHVGDVGLDCRYCHTSVETSASAGFPSTQICLNCHSQLFSDAPLLAPVRDSAKSGNPIAWNRVHRLPDFVYFDHSIHISKGVACIECHGRVDQMPLMRRVATLQMEWCVKCHRNPLAHLHDPSKVFSMQPLDDGDTATVRMIARLLSERRLTDCSTCHR